jgi:hypothetical protein
MKDTLLDFREVSALLEPNDRELTYGCAIANLLGETHPQIVCVTAQGPNRLYRWDDSTGKFVDVASEPFADEECSGIGVACADVDGDGRLDVYVLNTTLFLGPDTDPDRLFLNRGYNRFSDAFADSGVANQAAGRSVCWVDVMGHGEPMAYVANYGVPNRLIGRDPSTGQYRDYAAQFGLDVVTGGRGLAASPILGGPRCDIFATNEGGSNGFFSPRSDFQTGAPLGYQDLAADLGLDDSSQNGRGIVVADLNRDGLLDLVWGNWEGPQRLFIQCGDGIFKPAAFGSIAEPGRVRTVIAADFDNDGWEEIFFNHIGEPNRLFHRTEAGGWIEQTPFALELPNGYGTGACVGDLNGDGFLDIFVAHGEEDPQSNALFFGIPNGNNYIRILPLTPAGAPAIGARVVLRGRRPQTRVIDGGSGYLCQMEPIAHFGLARETVVPIAYVQWPDGAEAELHQLPANQTFTVAHPARP